MICPHEHIVQKGWRIEIPYEDKVDVLTNQHIVHMRWRFSIVIRCEDKDPNQQIVQRGGKF